MKVYTLTTVYVSKKISSHVFIGILVGLLLGCSGNNEEKLFKMIPSKSSGLHFDNRIIENDSINILDYEYLYNGGGIGVADFNRDGLEDLFFTGNMVSSRLYLNLGGLKFLDITEEAGVKTDKWCTGVSIVDINNDGWPDIHVSTGANLDKDNARNYFFINKTAEHGEVVFEDMAVQMGLAEARYSIQAVWLDYDRDNDLDLFVINNALENYSKSRPIVQDKKGRGKSTDKLFRNEGLTEDGIPYFKDVSLDAGISIEGWSLGVLVSDFNFDNYPDIYIANDFVSNDLLYINQKDGTFKNQIEQIVRHQSHNSMGVNGEDLNNDGNIDLVVLDMLPEDNLRQKTMFADVNFSSFEESIRRGYQKQYVRNVLQINNGNGSFNDVAHYAGISATDWSWAPLIADFNNDGYRDIYVTNGYKKNITDLDFMDFNNKASVFGGTTKRKELLIEQLNEMEGVKKSNFFFKNNGMLQFSDATLESGLHIKSYSNGAVHADLDLDGDLDIVVSNINAPVLLFENQTNPSTKPGSNYIGVKFPLDYTSLGARVWVYVKDQELYAEFYPHKGYLSSLSPSLHFGVQEANTIDSLKIQWPNGSVSKQVNIPTNQIIEPKYDSAKVGKAGLYSTAHVVNLERQNASILPYYHEESLFDDFRKWPLFFRSYSKPGPVMEVGDVNADGLEDLFVGGTSGSSATIFLQDHEGGFQSIKIKDGTDVEMEDAAALFFDADGDGDLDLYCVSGSSEHYMEKNLLQDRLYRNNGNGTFSWDKDALPEISSIGGSVVALDFDNDNDLDLFVGGRIDPENYPHPPRSYLLENDKGYFKDVTEKYAKELKRAGMITDVAATDINGDGWTDIIVVGEWMAIEIYYNKNGTFIKDTSKNGLEHTNGWWNCIEVVDLDSDGDMDFLVGNWGLNNLFTASRAYPLSLHGKDFDQNGDIEAIFTRYIQGKEYIVHPWGTLTKQLPFLRKRINGYEMYGNSTFADVFSLQERDNMYTLKTYELASLYVENLGGGMFKKTRLPGKSQWTPIFDFEVMDVNKDGRKEVLAVGNFYDVEVLTGQYDAGDGICLEMDGNNKLVELDYKKTGFYVPDEARSIISLENKPKSRNLLVVGLQNDSLKIFQNRYLPITNVEGQ